MHARYVRVFFVGGLVALALGAFLALATLAKAPVPPFAHVELLVFGVVSLALALVYGILPAFARRDWPTPLHAASVFALAALALPFVLQPRAFAALLGAALVVGALQPLALLLSPRWPARAEADAHPATDLAAQVGMGLALLGALAGGALLIALPRGLPSAALAVLLLGCAIPAAIGALLFFLPRKTDRPTRAATLGIAACATLAFASISLAAALVFPVAGEFRWPVMGVALGFAFAILSILRLPRGDAPLLAAAFALAILSALALLLATANGPNLLLSVALYALLALAIVLVAAALVLGAPIMLPGRPRAGRRWPRWGGALLIGALFLYTPALQYARSAVPAGIVAAVGLALLLWGLAPLASSSEPAIARR